MKDQSEAGIDQNHSWQASHIPAGHCRDVLSPVSAFGINPDICAKRSLDVLFGFVS